MIKRKILAAALSVVTLCSVMSAGVGAVSVQAATDTAAVSVEAAKLTNRSTINTQQLNAGETLTIKAVASGGTAPYSYRYYYRTKDSYSWELLDKYNDKTRLSRKTSRSGYYYAKIVITDAKGASAEKIFPVTVVKATGNPMVNASKLSQTTMDFGESVEMLSTVRGGTKPYTYSYSVKEYNGSAMNLADDRATDTYIYTPYAPGYYTMTFTAKDMDGTEASKNISLTVTKKYPEKLSNESYIRRNVISAGQSLIVNGSPKGGTAPYRYSYYYKLRASDSWLPLSVNNKSNVFSYKFDEPGYYDFLVRATDYTGKRKDKKLQFAVTRDTGAELQNTSTLSETTLEPEQVLTINASAAGGKEPYRYRYYIRYENGNWKRTDGYTPKDVSTYTPDKPGRYTAKIMIADANDNVVEKEIGFIVGSNTGEPLSAEINAGSTELSTGEFLTLTGSAAGGTTPYQYRFFVKKNDEDWSALCSYSSSDNFTLKMNEAGNYSFRVAVKDADGNEAEKDISVKVSGDTGLPRFNDISVSSTVLNAGQFITLNGIASGGTTPYQYKFYYRIGATGWTVLRDYAASPSHTLRLDDPGAYTFRVAVKFGDNTVAVKDIDVDVISSLKLTVKTTSPAMKSARWADEEVMTVYSGTTVDLIQKYGRWYKIRYNNKSGWMYNLAFTGGSNYTDITTGNLPIVADDIIFKNGRGIRTLYDYVTYMSYRAMEKDTLENMCVFMLKYKRGACYQRAGLLYYLLNRAGYEVVRVDDGIDQYTGGGPHNWVIIKTSSGWRHIDPTPVRGLSVFYLVRDNSIAPYFTWNRNKYPACT